MAVIARAVHHHPMNTKRRTPASKTDGRGGTRKVRGPKSRAIARMDKMFSKYVRARDKFCQSCGSPNDLQCSHIVKRRYLRVRFDPENAMALCMRCHATFTASEVKWIIFVDDHLGIGRYAALHRRADTNPPLDYEATEAWLKSVSKDF